MSEKRKRGRPRSKRSDPSYTTLTVLIRKETYRRLKIRAVEEERELSQIVQDLLDAYLS